MVCCCSVRALHTHAMHMLRIAKSAISGESRTQPAHSVLNPLHECDDIFPLFQVRAGMWPSKTLNRLRSDGNRNINQLYRSSSFNSSGCGSGGEPADDMYSDVSLEEDVQGLNYKLNGNGPVMSVARGMIDGVRKRYIGDPESEAETWEDHQLDGRMISVRHHQPGPDSPHLGQHGNPWKRHMSSSGHIYARRREIN
ncbi:hypothetical protein MSG28_005055 [Choristoneura fumiferana]|uniref:Uncharacterized protein n=1 Tax=Choristoneura fumiferana TaxID=7141 RepID=A0ACC0JPK5_CHOFU|nr:hypothetical protein MSG28_005055 [Choristoneura fumiferana]